MSSFWFLSLREIEDRDNQSRHQDRQHSEETRLNLGAMFGWPRPIDHGSVPAPEGGDHEVRRPDYRSSGSVYQVGEPIPQGAGDERSSQRLFRRVPAQIPSGSGVVLIDGCRSLTGLVSYLASDTWAASPACTTA